MTPAQRRLLAKFMFWIAGLAIVGTVASVLHLYARLWDWFPDVTLFGVIALLVAAVMISLVADELWRRDTPLRGRDGR